MCNCIEETTKMVREFYDGKFKKPIKDIQLQTCLNFSKGRAETYTEVKIGLVGQKTEETVTLVHTYCPFCGVRKHEKEA